MTKEQMIDLSKLFAEQVIGSSPASGTAPFTVQYGYVDTVCCHDGVRILDCPKAILVKVIAWSVEQTPYVGVSIHDGALFVR